MYIFITDIRYLQFADSLNFRLISPNVDAGMPIDEQLEIAATIKQQYPDKFAFFGTFSIGNFNNPDFTKQTIARIDKCMKDGASGIKCYYRCRSWWQKGEGVAIVEGRC